METENVIWRDVVICDGLFAEAYQANSLGEVWSKDRYITVIRYGKEYKKFLKGVKYSPGIVNGYLKVNLNYNGYKEEKSVHQIIATSFPDICGEWFPGAEIDHIDGNPSNNRPENLEYKDHKGNMNNPITRERMSESKKGAIPWNKGKHFDEETRLKISKSNKGKNTGNNHNGKAVLVYNSDGVLVKEFENGIKASKWLNVSNTQITKCCNGFITNVKGYIIKHKNKEVA